MRTVFGAKPQSWLSLAANIYSHLDNERSEAAKAAQTKHAYQVEEALMRAWGFERKRAAQAPDWFPRKGQRR